MKRTIKTYHLIFFIITALIFLNGLIDVAAQSSPPFISLVAEPAYNGNFKYGEWLPIFISLSNQGPDIAGTIEVDITQSGGNITYAKSISLPTGSKKQIYLSVLPNNFSRELEVSLVANQEIINTQKISVSPNQNDSLLVGISASERGALSLVSNINLKDAFRQINLFDLDLSTIPDKSREIESLDVIILNNIDTSKLSINQKKTFEDWISNGGHLIIGGGGGIEKTIFGLPDSIKKFSIGAPIQTNQLIDLETFAGNQKILIEGPFTISKFFIQGGNTTLGDKNAPILHQWNYGLGKITLSALDLSEIPFNAWSGTTIFWERILADEISFPPWMPRDIALRQMRANSMSYPLSNLPALDIPSISTLGIVLIFYIITIGPVNFFILKWKNKLQLAWASIPIITLLFTAGTFGVAYTLRGNDVMVNKLSIIELSHDGNAIIDSYIGVFSPSQNSYEIQIDGDQLLSPSFGGYYDPWISTNFNTTGQTTFIQGNPSIVKGLNITQWSMQSFNVEAITTYLGSLKSSLILGDQTLSGTLESELNITIENAVLVTGQETFSLGDLNPNTEASYEFFLEDQNLNLNGNPLTYQILETAFPGSSFDYQRNYEVKRAILDNYFQPYGYWLGPNLKFNNLDQLDNTFIPSVFIIGWTSDSPPEILLDGETISQNSLSLIIIQVPVTLEKSGFKIPPSLILGNIIEQPQNSGYCGSATTNLYMDYGTAKFEFALPFNSSDATITNLSLFFNEDISQWSQVEPGFSLWIYNWETSAWTQIPDFKTGINNFDPTNLVSSDGIIRLQVDKEKNNTGGCIYLGVGIDGILINE